MIQTTQRDAISTISAEVVVEHADGVTVFGAVGLAVPAGTSMATRMPRALNAPPRHDDGRREAPPALRLALATRR